ncbi:MAG: hypothetical protein LH614_05735 [Pyrinomonadaceae bacterium]|nr:hypothetical protein [Pyrinomonadaceae bacterium]
MDVYHKVLLKLYQVTGGKDSQIVDLKDLVKNLGFLGNYNDISQMLSGQGWIAETPKLNYVRITHWGVKEANKSGDGGADVAQVLKKEVTSLVSNAKQFLILLEEFSSDTTRENFNRVEDKLNGINSAVKKLQANIQ